MKELNFNEIVDTVTKEVKSSLTYIISESQENSFRKYFEDLVVYETIGVGRVRVYGDAFKTSDNISSALIASGIKRNGVLEKKIEDFSANGEQENLIAAKKRAQELELDYLDGDSFGKRVAQIYTKVDNHDEILNPVDLIKVGVCMQDRQSGYVEDHTGNNSSYINFAKGLWLKEKMKYIRLGLTDKPYYQILEDIFEHNEQKHYPLVTREAMEEVADFTFRIDHADTTLNLRDLHRMYAINDASRQVGFDVIEYYDETVTKSMHDYTEKHSGVAKRR